MVCECERRSNFGDMRFYNTFGQKKNAWNSRARSYNSFHMTPNQFVEKWRDAKLKERSAYQSHFNDVCALLGHPTPIEADPEGTWFTFEAFADKTHGGTGFADVWKKDFFAWEYKGKHANLTDAYKSLSISAGTVRTK